MFEFFNTNPSEILGVLVRFPKMMTMNIARLIWDSNTLSEANECAFACEWRGRSACNSAHKDKYSRIVFTITFTWWYTVRRYIYFFFHKEWQSAVHWIGFLTYDNISCIRPLCVCVRVRVCCACVLRLKYTYSHYLLQTRNFDTHYERNDKIWMAFCYLFFLLSPNAFGSYLSTKVQHTRLSSIYWRSRVHRTSTVLAWR